MGIGSGRSGRMRTVEQELFTCTIPQLKQILFVVPDEETKKLIRKIIRIKKEMKYRDRFGEED